MDFFAKDPPASAFVEIALFAENAVRTTATAMHMFYIPHTLTVSNQIKEDRMTTDKTLNTLNPNGFLRLKDVLRLFPVSKSTWWLGIQHGRFPKPVKLSTRITAWRVCDIQALLQKTARQNELAARDSGCDGTPTDCLTPKNNN